MDEWTPVAWTPVGSVGREAYEQRRDRTTRQELNKLLASPEFAAWQREKACAKEVRWALVGGAGLAVMAAFCTCLLLVLGAGGPAGRAVAAAAQPHGGPGLQPGAAAYSNGSASSARQVSLKVVPPEVQREQELLRGAVGSMRSALHAKEVQLSQLRRELEEALDMNSDLSIAMQAAAAAALVAAAAAEGKAGAEAAPLRDTGLTPPALVVPVPAALPAGSRVPPPRVAHQICAVAAAPEEGAYANSTSQLRLDPTLFSTWADRPAPPQPVAEELAGLVLENAPLLVLLGAAGLLLAWFSARQQATRLRKASEELQGRLEAAAARLADTAFAKETVEQSLQLLEQELQRKVKQVEDLKAHASPLPAATPAASDPSSPFTPIANPLYTPGRGELPPPPAQLVEKFLAERHAVAVEEGQVQEWLLMEEEFARMREELDALAEQRASMQAFHTQIKDQSRDEASQHLKEWLVVAQEELLTTQSQLQESEAEVRRLSAQLAAARRATEGAQGGGTSSVQEAERGLLEQNLELVAQLQNVTSAFETLQAQFSSTSLALVGKEAESRRAEAELQCTLAEVADAEPEALSASSSQAELSKEVDSILEVMRATRTSLAARLSRSQEVCAQTITGLCKLARQEPDEAPPSPPASMSGEASLHCSPVRQAPPPASAKDAAAPTPLGEAAARQNANATAAEGASVPTNFSFTTALPSKRGGGGGSPRKARTPLAARENTPLPAGTSAGTKDGEGEGSLRKTREAAKQQVAAIRSQYSNWELGAFLQRLGCAKGAAPTCTTRAEFAALRERGLEALQQKAAKGKTAHERAVAGEAVAMLQDWAWLPPVKAPPQSPSWFSRVLTRAE